MRFPESKVIDALREKYPAGCRVKLTKMDDVQAPPIGTLGTCLLYTSRCRAQIRLPA